MKLLSPDARAERRLAICLALIAGYVDAYGVIALGAYVSFMSGNTTQTGLLTGQGKVVAALPSALAIVFFLAGVLAGTWPRPGPGRRKIIAPFECSPSKACSRTGQANCLGAAATGQTVVPVSVQVESSFSRQRRMFAHASVTDGSASSAACSVASNGGSHQLSSSSSAANFSDPARKQ